MRDLGEWGLLDRLLPPLSKGLSSRVVVRPGDDAAVVRPKSQGPYWLFTTDMLVEGVHFERQWTRGEDLGHKALAVNLSDLAAMGDVTPAFGLVALGITPKTPVDYVESLFKGMQKLAKSFKVEIVGGDTVRADRVVVSVSLWGWTRQRSSLLLRKGARVGDVLMVTGTLGDGAAGLALAKKPDRRLPYPVQTYLLNRLRRPQPRLAMARRLARSGQVSALMDISDGLWQSVQILCRASHVGARVDSHRLPLSGPLRRWSQITHRDAGETALAGGDDYELLFTVPLGAARLFEARGWARPIGEIVSYGKGVQASKTGSRRREPVGFQHFGA